MLIEDTVTYLEMTSEDQLIPGRPPPASIHLEELGRTSVPLVHSVYDRIAEPHGWLGRSAWADDQWDELLCRPEVRIWKALVEDSVAGLVELEHEPAGDVEIAVFGLVPEFVGKGYGGHLLTLAVQLAWTTVAPSGAATRRVWLHTSSRDHPHALANYERRGFRPFKKERRQRP